MSRVLSHWRVVGLSGGERGDKEGVEEDEKVNIGILWVINMIATLAGEPPSKHVSSVVLFAIRVVESCRQENPNQQHPLLVLFLCRSSELSFVQLEKFSNFPHLVILLICQKDCVCFVAKNSPPEEKPQEEQSSLWFKCWVTSLIPSNPFPHFPFIQNTVNLRYNKMRFVVSSENAFQMSSPDDMQC